MVDKATMRQRRPAPRPPGAPWRIESRYPLFEIFRTEYIAKTSGYSKPYLRQIALGTVGIPDKLVHHMLLATLWSVEQLFGPTFLKEWKTDHPKAK